MKNENVEQVYEEIPLSRKDEIFKQILNFVVEETDISAEIILSDKRDEDSVLARIMFAHFLKVNGFSNSSIAERLGKTPAGVRNMHYLYMMKKGTNKLMDINLEYLKKNMESIGLNV